MQKGGRRAHHMRWAAHATARGMCGKMKASQGSRTTPSKRQLEGGRENRSSSKKLKALGFVPRATESP